MITEAGHWTQGTGLLMLVTGCRLLVAGQIMEDLIPICRPEGGVISGMLVTGCWAQGTGRWILDAGCKSRRNLIFPATGEARGEVIPNN